MIIEITPIRATLRYKRLGNYVDSMGNVYGCRARLVFRNWGEVRTGQVCLIYQLSADNLAMAVDAYIDLSDLDDSAITSRICTGDPKPGDPSCVVAPGVPTESDVLYNVEIECQNPSGGWDKYLAVYDIKREYHKRPVMHVYEMHSTDRSLNPGFVEMDPVAVMVTRGFFDDTKYIASLRLTTGEVMQNLPVGVTITESGPHNFTVKFTITTGVAGTQGTINDIEISYIMPDGSRVPVGRFTNLGVPIQYQITYTNEINTIVRI